MATARALLARVHKLGQDRAHPVLAAIGGPAAWEALQAEADEGVSAGRYDCTDMPAVVAALREWLGQLAAVG